MRAAASALGLVATACASTPEPPAPEVQGQAAAALVARFVSTPEASEAATLVDWDAWQRHRVLWALSAARSGDEATRIVRSAAAALAQAPTAAREAFVEEGWRARPECLAQPAAEEARGRALPVLFPFAPDPGTLEFIVRQRRHLEGAVVVSLRCPGAGPALYLVDVARGRVMATVDDASPTPAAHATSASATAAQKVPVRIALESPVRGALVCFDADCRPLPLELRARAGERLAFAVTAPGCVTTVVEHTPRAPGSDRSTSPQRWLLLPILR